MSGASWTITQRPVFSTEARIVSASSGLSVATSITSAETPRRQRIGGREGLLDQGAPGHERDVAALAHDEAAVERQGLAVVVDVLLDRAVDPRGLEEDDRVGIADRGEQQAVGARGEDGMTTRRPGMWANIASGLSE